MIFKLNFTTVLLLKSLAMEIKCLKTSYIKGCTNPGCQAIQATKFSIMVANICGSSENMLLQAIFPTTRVLEDWWPQLKCRNLIVPRELHLLCYHE